jgi:peptide/nickel transport system ATP-binding protein/oligopeptide transport system ATP-binding protein
MPLARAERLHREFAARDGGAVYAVDGVDLALERGEVVGLIGESGSGKSTVGRLMVRLLAPTSGTVEFEGRDLAGLSSRELRRRRGDFRIVFQEPYESLNPRLTVRRIVEEPLVVQRPAVARQERRRRVADTLEEVGLSERHAELYPKELSGGQQQRVGIARALITKPRLIVLDEPTSSLDLTVRAAILNMLDRLRAAHGLTYLFISHDIQTVRYFCTRTAVMYLGRIVESGPTAEVLENPRHPYTRALLSAALSVRPDGAPAHMPLSGDPPVPTVRVAGCPLVGRCPIEVARCRVERPLLEPVGPGHTAACHRAEE